VGKEGYLGEFEQVLLLTIMRLDDEAYGVRIMSELEGVDALRKSREALLTLWDGLEHALGG
jgi:hypothetical protein